MKLIKYINWHNVIDTGVHLNLFSGSIINTFKLIITLRGLSAEAFKASSPPN